MFALVLVVGSVLYLFISPKTTAPVANVNTVQQAAMQMQDTNTTAQESPDTRSEVKVAGEGEEAIPVIDDKSAKDLKAEKKVVLSVESAGRVNPFLPTFDDFNGSYYAGLPAQVLAPPDQYGDDQDAQELLEVSVSGILFDSVKPSAIVTINSMDYFVQKGDTIDDYLILGDSRATGFYLYGYLLESRVYAYNGATILNIDEWIDSIQQLQPQNIYIAFGMNDIKNNLNNTSNGSYSQLLSEQIKKILNVCPQANIYVNSIIPASQSVTQSNSDLWSQIDVYNAQIQQACQDNGWTYIDNSSLVQDQSEPIYESDGIHFVSSFYEKWARNIMGVLE